MKPSNKVILHKTLKVKREADKVKAVYSLGSGYQVKVVSDLLDLDDQTVRQYFLDYTKQDKRNRKKRQWVQLHYSGKFDNHLQGLFLRRYRRLLKTKGKNDVILFADAMHKNIKLHFLPHHSPNLNLIERLWTFFNEKVRNNRYYASFKKLRKRVKDSFAAERNGQKNYAHDSHKTFTNSKPMF